VQFAQTTEPPDPALVLSRTATVAGAAATSWGSEEHQRLLPPHHHRPPLAPAAVRKTWANYVRSISPQGGGRIGWTGLQCCTSVPDLRRNRSSATTDHNKERILLGTRFPRPRAVMERRHMQIHRAMNRKPSGGARRGRRGRWGLEDEGARVPAQEQLPVTRVDSSPLCQRDPVN
jgi:hypothetical protein